MDLTETECEGEDWI